MRTLCVSTARECPEAWACAQALQHADHRTKVTYAHQAERRYSRVWAPASSHCIVCETWKHARQSCCGELSREA